MSSQQNIKIISGLSVTFPCEPYGTQLAMSSKILEALQKSKHGIIESPTGSGKTLVLICSSLCWQRNEYGSPSVCLSSTVSYSQASPLTAKHKREPLSPMPTPSFQSLHGEMKPPFSYHDKNVHHRSAPSGSPSVCLSSTVSYSQASPLTAKHKREPLSPMPTPCCYSLHGEMKQPFSHHDKNVYQIHALSGKWSFDDDDFNPNKINKGYSRSNNSCKKIKSFSVKKLQKSSSKILLQAFPKSQEAQYMEVKKEAPEKFQKYVDVGISSGSENGRLPKEVCKRRVSKIYYGTRTHKQIAQIVRELKKTVYKDVRMSVLGSRDQTCIHPVVSKMCAKNDFCRERLAANEANKTCEYFHGANKIKTQVGLASCGISTAWDIEDLMKLGKSLKACPYYASRGLKEEADIVFCPYNYIIDPLVRESMDISLKEAVLIFDEAHNIEDTAREAASWTVTVQELCIMRNDMEKIKHYHSGYLLKCYAAMEGMISRLHTYVMEQFKTLTVSSVYKLECDFETGPQMVAVLKDMDMGPEHLKNLKSCFRSVKDENGSINSTVKEKLSTSTVMGLKSLFKILTYLYKEDMKYAEYYRVDIAEKNDHKEMSGQYGLKSRRKIGADVVVELHFWCLNPAVAFADFKDEVRSIIITSGTLTPFDSFQSELGVTFDVRLEARPLVSSSQVWVGSIGVGPSGRPLNGTFRNAVTVEYQDEVGQALLQICKAIPYGVLCFIPSYSFLDKLLNRWKETRLLEELKSIKVVVSEKPSSNSENFCKAMDEFFDAVRHCDVSKNGCTITGALLIAVYRGKVSEGQDFPDNYARAVVTVGIPFPCVKDPKIRLKRSYNKMYNKSSDSLRGNSWYELQAYRPLNQALGRCIRHREDWGVMILLDERFVKDKKRSMNLSKWIRRSIGYFSDFGTALMSVKQFITIQLNKQGSVRRPSSAVASAGQDLSVLRLGKKAGSSQLQNDVKILPSSSASDPQSQYSDYQLQCDLFSQYLPKATDNALENVPPYNSYEYWTPKNCARKQTLLANLQDLSHKEKSRFDLGRNVLQNIWMNLPQSTVPSSEDVGDISVRHTENMEMFSVATDVRQSLALIDDVAILEEFQNDEF